MAESTTLHDPVAQNRCVACRDPQGADHDGLLTADYPEETYLEFDVEHYRLCWSCHDRELVLTPRTESLTRFRNGSVNLHALHVNQVKGRACHAFHDLHGSYQKKLIKDNYPRSSWNLPVSFTTSPSGGRRQVGFHRKFRCDRDNPVSYWEDCLRISSGSCMSIMSCGRTAFLFRSINSSIALTSQVFPRNSTVVARSLGS